MYLYHRNTDPLLTCFTVAGGILTSTFSEPPGWAKPRMELDPWRLLLRIKNSCPYEFAADYTSLQDGLEPVPRGHQAACTIRVVNLWRVASFASRF